MSSCALVYREVPAKTGGLRNTRPHFTVRFLKNKSQPL